MLTIRYEEYYNDNHRRNHEASFNNLNELADWVFNQMERDYSGKEGTYVMWFPKKEPSRVSFSPAYHGPSYWIHQVHESGRGIIFSDGTFTSGQKHWTNDFKAWCVACSERQFAPKFDFAE